MELDRVSLSELNRARAEFPQVYKAQPGGGHGRGFGFSFYYCNACDEFVEWDDFGMTEETRTQYQVLMRDAIKRTEGLNNEQS